MDHVHSSIVAAQKDTTRWTDSRMDRTPTAEWTELKLNRPQLRAPRSNLTNAALSKSQMPESGHAGFFLHRLMNRKYKNSIRRQDGGSMCRERKMIGAEQEGRFWAVLGAAMLFVLMWIRLHCCLLGWFAELYYGCAQFSGFCFWSLR